MWLPVIAFHIYIARDYFVPHIYHNLLFILLLMDVWNFLVFGS